MSKDKAIQPADGKAPKMALSADGVSFTSFTELWEWSQGVAKSALIPDSYRGKPHDIMVAVQMGMEVGLRPMTALQNMAVVHGKPSLYGEVIMGMIRGAGVMDETVFEEHFEFDGEGKVLAAVCTMGRIGGKPRTERFSVEDAEQAGLWMSGAGWKKYPKDMLLWKARHRNEKALFSDILHGLIPREIAEGDQPATTVEQVRPTADLDELVRQHRAKADAAEPESTEGVTYDGETGEVIDPEPERQPGDDDEDLL